MAEDHNVHIVEWPKEGAARLEHLFNDKPLQVSMLHNQGQAVPLCIKLCEPICAESNYRIGINLLGQPFAEIVIKGVTRLFNCRDNNDKPNDRPNDGPVTHVPTNPVG
ncbi:hypothetical protein [Chitinophaga sp. 22620]|jgi:hypothetical protein|uniref:hypothetical protein n=1 Tax=Chitinophaga sp. 22620 TaxID=3453952 RepID=UPI003F839278